MSSISLTSAFSLCSPTVSALRSPSRRCTPLPLLLASLFACMLSSCLPLCLRRCLLSSCRLRFLYVQAGLLPSEAQLAVPVGSLVCSNRHSFLQSILVFFFTAALATVSPFTGVFFSAPFMAQCQRGFPHAPFGVHVLLSGQASRFMCVGIS